MFTLVEFIYDFRLNKKYTYSFVVKGKKKKKIPRKKLEEKKKKKENFVVVAISLPIS